MIGLLIGVAAVLALGLINAPAAVAVDNLVPTPLLNQACLAGQTANRVCRTDNAQLTFYLDSYDDYKLEQEDKEVVRNAMFDEYQPTQLSVTEEFDPTFYGAAETDIIFEEGPIDWAPSAAGIAWCDDEVNGATYECDQAYVRILGGGNYTKKRSCHEAGHAVGLTHAVNSESGYGNLDPIFGCMRTPTSDPSVTGNLGSNQVANINAAY